MPETEPIGPGHGGPGPAVPQPAPGEAGAFFDVPLPPALASHVQLVGELQGTGFRDRQWLIQRDGHFIQVSELLYRIAEHADGEHSFDEIAERATDATEWRVTADQVRHLVQTKLIPLGIVAPTEGGVVATRSP